MPAFVIQDFCPLSTHSSPAAVAWVRMEAVSLPASRSDNAYENVVAPSASGRRYFCFRSSDPARINGVLPSLLAPGIRAEEAHTRATSSTTMADATASAPTPPYSSGTWGAWKSEATRASYAACGKDAVRSTSAALRRDLVLGD